MYKNLFTINFNLKEICRELRKKNVQFSTNGKVVSILPISIMLNENYVGVYQDYGNNKLLFKEDSNLCNLIKTIIDNCPTIKTESISNTTNIFGIHIIISTDDIIVMQNGKIL